MWPYSDYVVVNMNGSRHPIPLDTVYHHLQPITASPYTFFQAFFGHEYPVSPYLSSFQRNKHRSFDVVLASTFPF